MEDLPLPAISLAEIFSSLFSSAKLGLHAFCSKNPILHGIVADLCLNKRIDCCPVHFVSVNICEHLSTCILEVPAAFCLLLVVHSLNLARLLSSAELTCN